MKPIEKDELYGHLSGFLRAKGIDLKDGSYSQAIQKSCGILTDVVNLSQQGFERAKTEIDKNVDRMRKVIHEKTAPKQSATASKPPPQAAKSSGKTASQKSGGAKPRRKSSRR